MARQLKVLMSAYACEPGKGSEPGVGWNLAVHMARFHHVWVLTRANNRPVIETELAKRPIPNLQFCYHDLPSWARFWKRGPRGVQPYYYLWQLTAQRVTKRLHKQVCFDLTHHVTFVKYWMPACVAFLDLPFIWGPVGGGVSTPMPFWRDLGINGILYETLRTLGRWFGEHDPLVRLTALRASVALATTRETATRLSRIGAQKVEILLEAALSRDELDRLANMDNPPSRPFRFVYIGRLLPLKGQHLGLQAFAQANLPEAEYWIVGGGPAKNQLVKLAQKLGVYNKVQFWGQLPRADALQKLGQCHVLVHPSLHESGGWACPEAMAAGKPVICLDIGGPAVQVTDECGFKIPTTAPAQTVHDIAAAMSKLYYEPALRVRMGEAARKRAQTHFNWDTKARYLNELYLAVCQK